jgi:hypothetical protein
MIYPRNADRTPVKSRTRTRALVELCHARVMQNLVQIVSTLGCHHVLEARVIYSVLSMHLSVNFDSKCPSRVLSLKKLRVESFAIQRRMIYCKNNTWIYVALILGVELQNDYSDFSLSKLF